jgi:hypothetical protein
MYMHWCIHPLPIVCNVCVWRLMSSGMTLYSLVGQGYPEDGTSKLFQNLGKYLPDYTLPWEPQISCTVNSLWCNLCVSVENKIVVGYICFWLSIHPLTFSFWIIKSALIFLWPKLQYSGNAQRMYIIKIKYFCSSMYCMFPDYFQLVKVPILCAGCS